MNVDDKLRRLVSKELAGKRLDQVLAAEFPQFSRARLQRWIRDGAVTVNGELRRQRDPVWPGEILSVDLTCTQQIPESPDAPEPIPLEILFEDETIIVVNKPAGLVVHPGAGHSNGTLVNGLLHHDIRLAGIPRAGLVHRLDKDTTGLLLVARTLPAHTALVRLLAQRKISREYIGLVQGHVTAGGKIKASLGRSPSSRVRMAVTPRGRIAVTHFRLAERFRAHTLLKLKLQTGRTHQIRVHMAHIGHPLVGDPTYGGRPRPLARADETLADLLRTFGRQALHAARLKFEHPSKRTLYEFESPIPPDLASLLRALRDDQMVRQPMAQR